MKHKLQQLLFIVIFGLSFMGMAQAADTQPLQPLDKVVAIVNNDVITESHLDAQVNIVAHQLKREGKPVPAKAVLDKQVLEHMIDQMLQLQEAKKLGVSVEPSAVNDAINNIAKQNKLTLGEFHKALEADGLNYSTYRKDIRNQLTMQQVQQQAVSSQINISKQEVDNYLKSIGTQKMPEFNIKNIFINIPEAPTPTELDAATQKAQNLVGSLRNGADFSQMAIAESDGPNALQGGDLGWRKAAQLPPKFVAQLSHMKKGEITDPMKLPSGYMIIKLMDKRMVDEKHYITQTHARHILLKTNAIVTDAKAKAELEKIRVKVEKGDDFAKMAKKYSQGPSGPNGGDLGWVSPGELVPPFEAAMNKLKPGQVSQPVKTQFGWHLIQVEARRKQDVTKAVQENQIRQMIYQRQFEEGVRSWISQLRQEAYIKNLLDPTDHGGEQKS